MINRNPIAILSFLVVSSFSCVSIQSCQSDEGSSSIIIEDSLQGLPEKPSPDITQKGDSMAILVLCDLSTSVDSESIGLMAENAGKLIRMMPSGSQIAFYPTEDNTMKSEIYSFRKRRPRRTSEKVRIKKEIEEGALQAMNTIHQNYLLSQAQIKDTQPRSCIWSNIEARISWFDSYSNIYCKYMVIMSDMIEQCKSSPVGDLYLEKKRFNKKKESLIDQYSKEVFANYDNVRVRCINSAVTYTQHEAKFLTSNQVREVWERIFQKMGYKPKLAYGPEFPKLLLNDCRNATQK